MDLFGPTIILSLGGKKYDFVIVDDYSRYTWVYFLLKSMSLSKYLKYYVKKFKMKKAFVFLLSEVTMKLSLKILSSYHSMKRMVFSITSLHKNRSSLKDITSYALVSEIEPKTIEEALTDDDQIIGIEEELHQFTRNNVWTLVSKPTGKNIIGTRCVFKNKLDEQGKVVRKKIMLVA